MFVLYIYTTLLINYFIRIKSYRELHTKFLRIFAFKIQHIHINTI